MWRLATLLPILAGAASGATVIDRIAVIVNRHAIKLSDIQRELRLTALINGSAVDLHPDAMRKAADRLVDQAMIRDEIAQGGFRRPGDSDAANLLAQFRQKRFGGVDTRLRAALAQYGVTEDQLRQEFLWQLTVLSFIDQRFRVGVEVSDQDLHTYYSQHLAELKRENPKANTFEDLESTIRTSIEGERINQNFEEWLAQERKHASIEYRQGAFS